MSTIPDLNLIRLFDFYLAVMLMLSMYRRWPVYRDALLLLLGFATRQWPRLLGRLHLHSRVMLTRNTLRPLGLALGLMAAQLTASRLLFPQAQITLRQLTDPWWQLAIALAAFIPMVLVDAYFIIRVGRFNRTETTKYFDKAESWAGTWQAKAVRVGTLGYVNPDRMVDEQVREGLQQLSATVAWAMWWVSTQVTLRLTFGLVLWLLWTLKRSGIT